MATVTLTLRVSHDENAVNEKEADKTGPQQLVNDIDESCQSAESSVKSQMRGPCD